MAAMTSTLQELIEEVERLDRQLAAALDSLHEILALLPEPGR